MVTIDEKLAFSDRLNLVLDEEGFPPKGNGRQIRLAKDWALTAKGVRKWLEGEGVPELTRLMEMAKRYSVNFEWLATGRDPITLQQSSTIIRHLQIPANSFGMSGEISTPARRLIEAIAEADRCGMPDRAFHILQETLKTFDDFLGPPPDGLLDVNSPRRPKA
ncbi:hypothetical protein [Burkholderia cepacia]|uniref:hypothetical protein n=1 Tax=Burkholderia cepacia TaxID=292 RepID=UPI0007535474|nr:hypothetical protein [Burkholderia cepacia]KVH55260.1 hypothetical protein WJ40_34245 [Burkholderia cepacia]